ncbi:hypothetical protein QCA50_002663 [Cerrena zonata]|uniref:Uncharacterized protein n=1 Tax=Cerrena zonata TaxID=2478898 RepID=A0AAW0GKA9_9APHY
MDSVKTNKPSFFKRCFNNTKSNDSTRPKLKPLVLPQAVAEWEAANAVRRNSLKPLLLPARVAERELREKPKAWDRLLQSFSKRFSRKSSSEQHLQRSEPQVPFIPVRDEAVIIETARTLFPPSFHAEGLAKVEDALADMEDLVANWDCLSDESSSTSDNSLSESESGELHTLDSTAFQHPDAVSYEDTPVDSIKIVVTECPTVNYQELDLNFGDQVIRGPFNSVCFALAKADFLEPPEGTAPIPRAEADWDFTCIFRYRRGDTNPLGRLSGGLFLTMGKSSSVMCLTTVTTSRNYAGTRDSPLSSDAAPAVGLHVYEDSDTDESASTADSDGPPTPDVDTDEDEDYYSDCPTTSTLPPMLKPSKVDLNFSGKRMAGLFDPSYFAFSDIESLDTPKELVQLPARSLIGTSLMRHRRKSSNTVFDVSDSLLAPQGPSYSVGFPCDSSALKPY